LRSVPDGRSGQHPEELEEMSDDEVYDGEDEDGDEDEDE
jgi:hypothetical protein